MSRQRLECAELAPAFVRPSQSDSASKLDALHTLREPGGAQPPLRLQQAASADKKTGINSRSSLQEACPRVWRERESAEWPFGPRPGQESPTLGAA
jgi:hypothetical protein